MSLIITNISLLLLKANESLQLTRCASLMDRSSWQPTSIAANSPQCSARQDNKRYNHVTLSTHQPTDRQMFCRCGPNTVYQLQLISDKAALTMNSFSTCSLYTLWFGCQNRKDITKS